MLFTIHWLETYIDVLFTIYWLETYIDVWFTIHWLETYIDVLFTIYWLEKYIDVWFTVHWLETYIDVWFTIYWLKTYIDVWFTIYWLETYIDVWFTIHWLEIYRHVVHNTLVRDMSTRGSQYIGWKHVEIWFTIHWLERYRCLDHHRSALACLCAVSSVDRVVIPNMYDLMSRDTCVDMLGVSQTGFTVLLDVALTARYHNVEFAGGGVSRQREIPRDTPLIGEASGFLNSY